MFTFGCLVVVVIVVFAGALVFFWSSWRTRRNEARIARARQLFRQRREWLEADFVTLASRSGEPRGLQWTSCEFDDSSAFVRDRNTGELRALAGVTIRFETIGSGPAAGGDATGGWRAATAVFRYDGVGWTTDGRAIFNLNPAQTIQRFRHELETVD